MLKWLKRGIALYLLGIAAIYIDGISSETPEAKYAVVLGNKVFPNGVLANRTLARVTEAARLYHENKIRKIITSGGIGEELQDEARVMARYLEKQGVPASAIIIDSKGMNTRATAHNARQWIQKDDPVIVVSQLYHLSRTKLAFRQAGFTQIGASYPLFVEWRDVSSTIRTVPAWLSYFFKLK